MKLIDRSLVRKRQEEIAESVRESSPVLVWPGEAGILVVAANKSRLHGFRIYPVHDRMAMVFRGEYASAKFLAAKAISAVYEQIGHYGPDEVDPAIILGILGQRIGDSYETAFGARVSAEAILVRLEKDPAEDFLGIAEYTGETDRLEGPLWRGPSSGESDEHAKAAEEALRRIYNPAMPPEGVLAILEGQGTGETEATLSLAMKPTPGIRLEAVLLDRAAIAAERYDKVFVRLP